MSGWEQSSTKQNVSCAARVPGGVNCKGNAQGFMFDVGCTVFDKNEKPGGLLPGAGASGYFLGME